MSRFPKHLLAGSGLAAIASLCLAAPAPARTVEFTFDADNFDDPTTIDNPFFPLEVGATFVYRAEGPDGCEESQVTVLGTTEEITIDGETIFVREVQDLEYEDEDCDGGEPAELVEQTIDYYGQDDFGNVWYFGEETFDCEGAGDCTLGEGAWEAGVDGALPGIIMLADPLSGDRYRQEFAEDVAEDWGMVMNLNRQVRLQRDDAFAPGEWDNCLITKEWNGLEPGSVEQKTYCEGIGLVEIAEHSGRLLRFELTDDSDPDGP